MNLSKANLLVVEDNSKGMEILSQILLGFGVTQSKRCGGVEEAMTHLATERFDLALIDDAMPGQGGLDLINWIRADPKARNYTLPCILLTSHPSRDKIALARDAGVNFVISKPITPAVLVARIEWIARENRAFVTSDGYRGPDRRFKQIPRAADQPERREEALRLLAEPEKALSQDEISSLFD